MQYVCNANQKSGKEKIRFGGFFPSLRPSSLNFSIASTSSYKVELYLGLIHFVILRSMAADRQTCDEESET